MTIINQRQYLADALMRVDNKSMEPTTVSIIILNYNGREHLETCLYSLAEIDFPKSNLEIIVVDNASSDGSNEMLASRFPQVRCLRSETNLGFSRGANFGAAQATGHYLAFLNNDMRVDRQWLTALLETARGDERLACVGSAILNWDGTGIDFVGRPADAFCLACGPNFGLPQPPAIPEAITCGLFVSAGAALIRAEAFHELGGFDADYFMYHEDVDLGWRLWLRGYRCALSPTSIVYHRGGASSRKLSADYVQGMAQKHVLFTLLKNCETETLQDLLPLVFYYLLERGRWVPAAQSSMAEAVDQLQASLDDLMARRAEVQRTRVLSDAELFSKVGHPFDFLLRQEHYQIIKQQSATRCAKVAFDLNAGGTVKARAAMNEWLNAAHFLFEQSIISVLKQNEQQIAVLSAEPPQLTTEIVRKEEELQRLTHQVKLLASQLAAKEEHLRALTTELSGTSQALSAQLAVKEERVEILAAELDQIKRSLGWRLLSYYGRIKYRYLLPIYGLLGRRARNNSPAGKPDRQGAARD